MRVHFIAIGGSAMHNLALALKKKGYQVSGSDDEIVEPSKTRLANAGILPEEIGWFPAKIDTTLDAIILGMHARLDNPELQQAQRLGIPVFSYPGYMYNESKTKKRVVIGGSHGKTSITALILHILKASQIDCDYLVGAQLKGFDTMVRLTKDAPVILLEGDEYLASPLEPVPKFHLYHPHVALISGIAWDHINVFPTFDMYLEQFNIFIQCIEKGGTLVYFEGDEHLKELVKHRRKDIQYLPYEAMPHVVDKGITYLKHPDGSLIPLNVFGMHNLQNIGGAFLVCRELGVSEGLFYTHIKTFDGAAKRLELVSREEGRFIYKDFAHSPSKLKATTRAVKEQFPQFTLTACMELHTFSSLNEEFLKEYAGCMDDAHHAHVYFNPHTVAHKRLKDISIEQVKEAFQRNDITVWTDSEAMQNYLIQNKHPNEVLLMMSSGTFNGMDFLALK